MARAARRASCHPAQPVVARGAGRLAPARERSHVPSVVERERAGLGVGSASLQRHRVERAVQSGGARFCPVGRAPARSNRADGSDSRAARRGPPPARARARPADTRADRCGAQRRADGHCRHDARPARRCAHAGRAGALRARAGRAEGGGRCAAEVARHRADAAGARRFSPGCSALRHQDEVCADVGNDPPAAQGQRARRQKRLPRRDVRAGADIAARVRRSARQPERSAGTGRDRGRAGADVCPAAAARWADGCRARRAGAGDRVRARPQPCRSPRYPGAGDRDAARAVGLRRGL